MQGRPNGTQAKSKDGQRTAYYPSNDLSHIQDLLRDLADDAFGAEEGYHCGSIREGDKKEDTEGSVSAVR